MLQFLHLDTSLLQQQNTKKLCGTKSNWVHAAIGLNSGQRYQKTQQPFLKSIEQKQGVGNKNRVLSMPPALNTTRGVGETPKPPSGSTPVHALTLTPYKEHAFLSHLQEERKQVRDTVVCSCCLLLQQGPYKPCLIFFSGICAIHCTYSFQSCPTLGDPIDC